MSTGLRAGTSNDGYLQVNGTDVLTALSSGNIGIGVTPTQRLDISSSSNSIVKINSNSANTCGLIFSRDGTESSRIAHSNSADLIFYTTNSVSPRLTITSSGNVGIGTTNPITKLNVYGQLTAKQQLYLNDASNSRILRITEIGSRDVRLDTYNDTDFNGTLRIGGQYLSFETGTGGSLVTGALTINSSQYVGIGTTNASAKFEVFGSNAAMILSGDAGAARILMGNRDSGGANNPGAIVSANGNLYFGGANSWDPYTTTFDYAMQIVNSGNVGIGVPAGTDPDEKLHVEGSGDLKIKLETTSSGVNSNVGLYLTTASEGSFILQTGNAVVNGGGGLRLYDITNSAERITVYPSGSLKVGTTFTHSSSGTSSQTPLWVNSPKNTVSMFVGDGQPTNTYGTDEYSSDIRFNGSVVAWGDLSYYPNGESGNGSFRFTRNGSTVGSTGNASIGVSKVIVANGGGIDFASNPNVAGVTSELLDDYEEGTFTPTYQTLNNNMTGFTNNQNVGKYTKIGRMVHVWLQIATISAASLTGTGIVLINGLPFAADDVSNAGINVLALTHDNRFINNPRYGQVQSLTTAIKLFKTEGMNTNNDGLTVADFTKTNSGNWNLLSIEFTYRTA